MKINLDWLREYVDVPESPQRLKDDLTMFGLVVEAVTEHQGSPVLEIEVTSNRPDCLSHFGIAREVAALYQRPVRQPLLRGGLKLRRERVPYSIEIRDPDLCPRYVGLVLDSVKIAASPDWMQRRLESAGMRPLNNVVDITNYVLMEMGHPLHAFDFQWLRGGKVVVARAQAGQKIITLDGIERSLDAEMLLINDAEGPVAIAGVMGGLHSEIAPETHTVLLECAYFRPSSVRRTARRLGLSTEASYRFERGVDWADPVRAIARASRLMQELAGARVSGSLMDVYPQVIAPVKIPLRRKRAEALLGVSLEDRFMESCLKRLNFVPVRKGTGAWIVTCPSYRADMEVEADVLEEVARCHGYQNIPATLPVSRTAGVPSSVSRLEASIRQLLMGLGYCEAVNLSFARETEHDDFRVGAVERVEIRNPLTNDTRFLRTSLVPGLVQSAKSNFNHACNEVRLFETGKIYNLGLEGRPAERNTLAILGTSDASPVNWLRPATDYNFHHLRGSLCTLLSGLRCQPFEISPAQDIPWLDSGSCAQILIQGTRVGVFGALDPALTERYKLKQTLFVAEVDLETLSRHVFELVRYEPLARYPVVERDLSIVINGELAYGDIRSGIMGLGIEELHAIELLDVYQGQNIPEGQISLTLRCRFLDRDKTLTVDRVQAFGNNILAFLANTFGAKLR
jgi:phenylalanyl-tRNA synthetase beta chain